MRGWWQEIAPLVLPVGCAGCGRPRTALCRRCRMALCGAGGARRVRPEPVPPGLPEVRAATAYQDAPRAVLLAHKERGALWLARPLGVALAQAVRVMGGAGPAGPRAVATWATERPPTAGLGPPDSPSAGPPAVRGRRPLLLVPVPSARRAVVARGHDPTRRIALTAAAVLRRAGLPVRVLAVLRQQRG